MGQVPEKQYLPGRIALQNTLGAISRPIEKLVF